MGYNSRLDALQAAVLRVKLKYLDEWNEHRRDIAKLYTEALTDNPNILAPTEVDGVKHVYHLYIIQSHLRAQIQEKLLEKGIASGIYYPKPLHLTVPCKGLGYLEGDFPVSEKASQETLAIPIYPDLERDQVKIIIGILNGIR